MSHTPGPWGHESDEGDYVVMTLSPARLSHTVAEVYNADDARLIAAAPDLLAALKVMLDPDAEGDVEQAIRAISKAEGTEAYAEEAARIIARIEGGVP